MHIFGHYSSIYLCYKKGDFDCSIDIWRYPSITSSQGSPMAHQLLKLHPPHSNAICNITVLINGLCIYFRLSSKMSITIKTSDNKNNYVFVITGDGSTDVNKKTININTENQSTHVPTLKGTVYGRYMCSNNKVGIVMYLKF